MHFIGMLGAAPGRRQQLLHGETVTSLVAAIVAAARAAASSPRRSAGSAALRRGLLGMGVVVHYLGMYGMKIG